MSKATTTAKGKESPDVAQTHPGRRNGVEASSDYPRDETIHTLFASQAAKSPDDVAIVFEDQSLSYCELDRRSNQLAHRLRKMGVAPDVLVALRVERSLDMVVGLFGILKAGGAYVPLDPAYPADRIEFMLSDSQAPVLLTQSKLKATLPNHDIRTLCLDSDWSEIETEPEEPVEASASATDLAYVIYTSGSTGRPKGVEISHRAVVNFLCSMRDEPGLSESDRLVAVTTLSFDIAGLELYLPLTVGARIILASRLTASDGRKLSQLIAETGATVMQATPATWRLLLEADWPGDPSFRIFCGGETFPRDLAERLLPLCGQLWNLYGPTEATIWSTVYRVETGSGGISIGHPIANTEIQILDEQLRPVQADTPGELYIGGDGLARGYLNRPELTAERFIAHPLDDAYGDKLYRTGDLARFWDAGNLEHLGRVDFQVKVRGFRIELGEIEAALEQQSSVCQAVVMAREDVPGEKRLVGYIVTATGETASARELRNAIGETLPDYMVPGILVTLDRFPLTPNGKVDRKALPAPDNQRPDMGDAYVAPRGKNEETLARIWAEVLRIDSVGVQDNYFDLGGDSLKVAQIATRVRESFEINVPIRAMFEHPTVAGLMTVIEGLEVSDDDPVELPIRRVPRDRPLPLSFAQERVWFIHQLNPENLAYNFQSSIRLTGALNVAALERSLDEIVRRHEAYRTTFPTIDGRPTQRIHPHKPFSLPLVDLSKLPADEREKAWQEWCDVDFQKTFDLRKLPLVEWTLFRFGQSDHVIIHKEHHTVHDGWAFNLFVMELVELYAAFSEGRSSPLPELEVQFADFAAWQHEWTQGAVAAEQLAYWKKRLSSIPPVLQLPTKGPRPVQQSFKGAAPRAEVPIPLVNDLRALSRQEDATLFMTMLGGFVALLHRYTGEPDVAVGTFFANRRLRESESLIGMILNNVVIRVALEKDPTVRELISQVKDVLLESANYQDVPFDRVVEAVQPRRDLSHNPLFQVMFSFHDEPMPERILPGLDVKLTPVLSNHSAKFDLGVIGIPHSAQVLGLPRASENDGLTMVWEHSTDLFELSTINRMIEHYEGLLEAMVQNPDQRISELPLGTKAELDQQLVAWNATDASYPRDRCVHQLIEAQVERTPDAVAVVFGDGKLSYRELETHSNQLAHYLREKGVKPGVLVGISVERSLAMVVALLGIWKAGGSYVPIDPAFPSERQAFMIEDAALSFMVTQQHLKERLGHAPETIICLDSDQSAIAGESERPLAGVAALPDNIAYVIYTSGSTGKPKGVQVPHRAVVNFLTTMAREPGLTATDRLLAVTTLSFDIAGLELFLPLTVGAAVIVASRDVAANGEELAKLLTDSGATIMQATPTTWRILIDVRWKGIQSFTALCGGEPLPRSLASELLPRVENLWNMYGPTETTIWSTIQKVSEGEETVPIGRPIANTQVYVLDAHDNPVPIGVVGELVIGGDSVALGYLHRSELTTERFIDDLFRRGSGRKIYRTGDLARYLPDGSLECLGRSDHQVKVRGFRIELGEIEIALGRHASVKEAVVIVREDAPGDKRLVGYFTSAAGAVPDCNELALHLREGLPDYMVPSAFVELDSFPLTLNDKIDRGALPEPDGVRQSARTDLVVAGSQPEEELVVIWQEILGVEPIGIRDDFFDIGGHSLLAVKLVSEIEVKMGTRVALATLLQNRTIEELARLVAGERVGKVESAFHAVQPAGDEFPFFAVVNHRRYADLAHLLDHDRPFYQLDVHAQQNQRLERGAKPFERVEDMAVAYLEDIRRVQPEGPYFLGGGCEGAYVSLEIALQLQKQGEEVACLVMWIPPPLRPSGKSARSLPARIMRKFRHLVHKRSILTGWRAMSAPTKREYLEYWIFETLESYEPASLYQGKITLVCVEESPPISYDNKPEWHKLASEGIDLHILPGNNENWVDNNLGELGDVVSRGLKSAGSTSSAVAPNRS